LTLAFTANFTKRRAGGSVGLLALNALFILMRDYNLYVYLCLFDLFLPSLTNYRSDYPSFYSRLYAFLDRDVLHLKHRARFFRLTELFLSSTFVFRVSGGFDIDLNLQALTFNATCIFRQATLKIITYSTASRHHHGCSIYL
jgi:hypothetical protein